MGIVISLRDWNVTLIFCAEQFIILEKEYFHFDLFYNYLHKSKVFLY
jgi:hypothetical protein